MIQPNELRIGNWVNIIAINQKVKIKSINQTDLGGLYTWVNEDIEYEDSLTGCEPIPLTPEILEKCGFRKDSEFNFSCGLPNGNGTDIEVAFDTLFSEWEICLKNANGFVYLKNINNLHQLQNLYFALTGNELTINELQ